jgi:hypothetical protein
LHIKEPETAEEICRQSIWHNTFIRAGRKTICHKRWLNSNINYIQDILDRQGKIMKQTELENKYNFRTDVFIQYKKNLPLSHVYSAHSVILEK